MFGLTAQMRRVAASIPSNIAEGHARGSTKEFMHHVSIGLGSLAEIETQLEIALSLQYLNKESWETQLARCCEVGKMLRGLQKALSQKLER